MIKLRQDFHVWYRLSCGCVSKQVFKRRGNTGECPMHMRLDGWPAPVFILETVFTKPTEDE